MLVIPLSAVSGFETFAMVFRLFICAPMALPCASLSTMSGCDSPAFVCVVVCVVAIVVSSCDATWTPMRIAEVVSEVVTMSISDDAVSVSLTSTIDCGAVMTICDSLWTSTEVDVSVSEMFELIFCCCSCTADETSCLICAVLDPNPPFCEIF